MFRGLNLAMRQRLARVDWADVRTRALRTFWQSAAPALALTVLPALQAGDWRGAYALAVPPVAAGISLAWNTVIRPAAREVIEP